jgi:LytS/YehU family sensor histidine kinase
VIKKFIQTFLKTGNVILFELDDWYDWYKEPKKFHNAVVTHLENEGKKVETISIVKNVTSNRISSLFIDGIKYELSVRIYEGLGPTQTVVLKKIEP